MIHPSMPTLHSAGGRLSSLRAPAARFARTAAVATAVAAGALGLGALTVWRSLLAGAFGGVLVMILTRALTRDPLAGPESRHRWIPLAWGVLFGASNWKIKGRSPLAAVSGSLSIENKIELVMYLSVGLLVVADLYLMPRNTRSIHIGPLAAWPVFAVLSTAWSLIPVFTIARSLQLFVPIMLTVLTVRIWRDRPKTGELIWRRSLRLIVNLITVAVAAGFVFHGSWPEGRFTWPGSPHPIVSAGITGLGFVLVVTGGRRLIGLSRASYFARVTLFAAALVFGQTRSAWLGIGLASVASLWLAGRNRPATRYLTIPLYVGSLFFFAALARSTVIAYAERGQYGGLSTLNNRLPLWQLAIRDVAARGRWLVGSGFGSTRVILFPQVSFAGEAHNTWVEFLIELGAIGVLLAVVAVAFLGYRLFRNRLYYSTSYRAGAGLFVYLLVLSQADNYLANLGFGFTTVALLYVLVLAEEHKVGRSHIRGHAATVEASGNSLGPIRSP